MDSIEKVSQSSAQVRKPLSLRLPARDIEAVEDFARSNRMSKTDAFLHFLHKGMDAESQQDDLSGIRQQLMQITSLLERNALGSTEQEIREAVAHVASEFPAIERAYLFGSVARGEFDDASDVDVRIELDSSMPFNLHDLGQFGKRIERIVGRSVDVISAREIKNEALAAAIAREKVLVYERKK